MRFLKGLIDMFLSAPFVMVQWDLNLVLTYLMCTPFELIHSYTLHLLIIKTGCLIAITSARRVSELQALSVVEPYTLFFPD